MVNNTNDRLCAEFPDAADRFYRVIGIPPEVCDPPTERRLVCIRIERQAEHIAELEVERDYYRQLSITCRKEKRYPSQNEISTLTGECPVHIIREREAKHCCGAQGFGFGDVCPACELEDWRAHVEFDRSYYTAILDGSWPSAAEVMAHHGWFRKEHLGSNS